MLKDPNNHLNRMARQLSALDPTRPAIGFTYVEGSRAFNTMRAHVLVAHEAVEADPRLQNSLMQVLFRKYFQEGRDLSTDEELVASAKEVGLSDAVIEAAVLRPSAELQRRVAEMIARTRRIRGVPHFTFPSGDEVSGSQPVEAFEEVLESCVTKA
jgi:predicted DsbA family dithiol-disulfide isomerase